MRYHLFIIALCLCAPVSAETIKFPSEVANFIERRGSCDHWRGEYGSDPERQADIEWAVCQSCRGTDAELARLKRKYSSNPKVVAILDDFEPKIEPDNKLKAERFCKSTRKPKWHK
jgi:hypothetical protein